MEKSINIIIPYFGRFPNYYPMFLKSCKFNPSINWTIITDCSEEYEYPKNVKKIEMTFERLIELVQSKFEFNVVLEKPHKLCDFKPAYGYIFEGYIEGYDYWGYGDLDLIYGNLRTFLNDDILNYPKIFIFGHLSLVRNEKKFNELFKQPIGGRLLYKEVFSSDKCYNFDETFFDKLNINQIFEQSGYPVWKTSYAADIYTKSSNFYLDNGAGSHSNEKYMFVWDKGRLLGYTDCSGEIKKQEFSYIHLQKRKMKLKVDTNNNIYKIIPNSFDMLEVPATETEASYSKIRKKYLNIHYFKIRYKNLKIKMKNKMGKST
jgi:hypothetical protein